LVISEHIIASHQSRPCGTNILVTFRATVLFVLMHSGIVNGYQLMRNAHTVLEPHRGTAAFLYFTRYPPIPLFHFICLSLWQSLLLFLGASIVCLNNLKKTTDLVLWFTDRTSVCTHPCHGRLNNLIVLKA